MKYIKTFEDISDEENFNTVLGFDDNQQEETKGHFDLDLAKSQSKDNCLLYSICSCAYLSCV